jgi:transcriptional regulator with XRE-family HTH domain
MQDRIQKILKEEGMTAARFADEIGIQASSVSHFLSGRNKPSTDILARILDRFRGLNAEWLVTGRGNMYKDQKNASDNSVKDTISQTVGDLFSVSAEKEQENISESNEKSEFVPESSVKTDKNTEITSEIHPLPNSKSDKYITKIVIFFSDNSFEYYNPRK